MWGIISDIPNNQSTIGPHLVIDQLELLLGMERGERDGMSQFFSYLSLKDAVESGRMMIDVELGAMMEVGEIEREIVAYVGECLWHGSERMVKRSEGTAAAKWRRTNE